MRGVIRSLYLQMGVLIVFLSTSVLATENNAFISAPLSATTEKEPGNASVSIKFFYLPGILDEQIQKDEMIKELESLVRQTNFIFRNSLIDLDFEVSGIKNWPTPKEEWYEASAYSIYLEMKNTVDQYWDQGKFYQWDADILFLVDYRDDHDTHCGWATIGNESGLMDSRATRSYGMIRLGPGCGASASVLAHEIGHLLGAAHGYGQDLRSKSHLGYGVQCGGKSTLMHPGFPKHDFVSNPDVAVGGEACGYQDAADNQQLFQENGPLLANKSSLNKISSDALGFASAPTAALDSDGEAGSSNDTISTEMYDGGSTSQGGSSDTLLLTLLIAFLCCHALGRGSKQA